MITRMTRDSRISERRTPFPDYIYRVDWPVDEVDLTKDLAPAIYRRIAESLLTHLLLPPPILPKAGGWRPKMSAIEKSPEQQSAFADKRDAFTKNQKDAHQNAKDLIALRLAIRLALREEDGEHRTFGGKYENLFHDFRLIKGFSRLLWLLDNNSMPRAFLGSNQKINSVQLQHWIASYFVFDLLDRMRSPAIAEHNVPINEGTAQHAVLLKQDQLGLETNYSSLSKICQTYRSVGHLMVALVGTWRREVGVEDRDLARVLSEKSRGYLTRLIASDLRRALSVSSRLQEDFSSIRIKQRGDVLVRALYQVRLPNKLVVDKALGVREALAEDEITLLKGIAADAARPLQEREWPRQKVTSSSAKWMREKLMSTIGILTL